MPVCYVQSTPRESSKTTTFEKYEHEKAKQKSICGRETNAIVDILTYLLTKGGGI